MAPGVEPRESVLARGRAALATAALRAVEGPVVLVGHDAVNSVLLAYLDPTRGTEPGAVAQATGCLSILQRHRDGWAVALVGVSPPG
jgi:broad specificity phosphatase PhoE